MREWIDRYVYAATRELPQNQRSDIERELRGLIEDMLDERAGSGETEADRLDAVLKELGHPEDLAAKYRGRERFLIGPGLFDAYVAVLKVVGASILLGVTIAFIAAVALDPGASAGLLLDCLVVLLSGAVNGFAWVTIIFAITERFGDPGKSARKAATREWSPRDLPPVPDPVLAIRASEPIVNLFFLVLGLLLFLASAGWLTINRSDSLTIIRLFDPETVNNRLLLIFVAFAVAMMREIGKLAERRWTRRLIAGHAITGVILLAAGLLLFADASIWNAGFVPNLADTGVLDASGEGFDIATNIWTFVQRAVPFLVAAGFAIDMAVVLLKLRRVAAPAKAR